MFVDDVTIEVVAGKGGDGSASFRREKFIPKGGPDGGDGGKGGDVVLTVREDIHGLAELAATRLYRAGNGQPGRGKLQSGRQGEDELICVPPGSIVYDVTKGEEQRLVDTATFAAEERFVLVRGGKGGLGNNHFKSSTNQAPRQFTPGTPGQRRRLRIVVNLIADVGLLGLPNVGKSTLLARVSNARPKVANYPFTTLEPHLGVVSHKGARFIMADIPGLIRGAAQGKGLGHAFLKHLRRTRLLVHLIDSTSQDPLDDYAAIRAELLKFDSALAARPETLALTKTDLLGSKEQRRLWSTLHPTLGQVLFLGTPTGRGITDLLDRIAEQLSRLQSQPSQAQSQEAQPDP